MLDRIIKGFWGRYLFYLSVFVAVYFLMREKLDNIIYELGEGWFKEGYHHYITLFILSMLSLYPIYRILKIKGKPIIDAAHIAYIFIPISLWYLIQLFFGTAETTYWYYEDLFLVPFCFTIFYSFILILLWLERPRIDHESKKSLLLMDIPERDIKKDKLGFASYVDKLAKHIVELHKNEKSFVLGIEGGWGSGKSTFTNFLKNEIAKDETITTIEFNPWMQKDPNAIVRDFFNRLAECIPSIELRTKFLNYGRTLAKIEGLGIAGKMLDHFCAEPDLKSQQDKISSILEELDLKLVVFIDDLDRLDKNELMAVLKLIRNTGDIYQTTYILNYHREYVEKNLENYFGDRNIGETYLDKIINVEYKLPKNTDLMHLLVDWFNTEAKEKEKNVYNIKDNFPPEVKAKFDTVRKLKKVYNTIITEFNFHRYYNVNLSIPVAFYYLYHYENDAYRKLEKAVRISSDLILRSNFFGDTSFGDYSDCKIIREIYYSLFNTKANSSDPAEKFVTTQRNAIIDYILSDNSSPKTFEENEIPLYFLAHLLKLDSTQESDVNYLELKNEFGDNGFNEVDLDFQNRENIIKRLIKLRSKYNSTYSSERSQYVYMHFIRENESEFKKDECILDFYKFCLALLMFMENYQDTVNLIVQSMMTNHYGNLSPVASLIDLVDSTCDDNTGDSWGYPDAFKTSYKHKFNVVSVIYNFIVSYLFDDPSRSIFPFTKEQVLEKALRHLELGISKVQEGQLHYFYVENALFTCWERKDGNWIILTNASIEAFKKYVEEQPDGFITYFIRPITSVDKGVVFHPFLDQFFTDKGALIEYLDLTEKKITGNTLEACLIIRKYVDIRYEISDPSNLNKVFMLEEDDFDKLFYLDKGEIKRKIYIPDPEDE
jgi:hypothetical protein